MAKVTMPQLGESVAEGTIGKWLKKPGDHVAKYEPLLEVITDKVNAEVPSPFEGVLKEILVEEGATVPNNAEIAVIEEAGGAADGRSPRADGRSPQPRPAARADAAATPSASAAAPAAARRRRAEPRRAAARRRSRDARPSAAAASPMASSAPRRRRTARPAPTSAAPTSCPATPTRG